MEHRKGGSDWILRVEIVEDEAEVEIENLRHGVDVVMTVPFAKLAEFVDAVRAERGATARKHTDGQACGCRAPASIGAERLRRCDACRTAGCHGYTGSCKINTPASAPPAPERQPYVAQPPRCPVCGKFANACCTDRHIPHASEKLRLRENCLAADRREIDRYEAWAKAAKR